MLEGRPGSLADPAVPRAAPVLSERSKGPRPLLVAACPASPFHDALHVICTCNQHEVLIPS